MVNARPKALDLFCGGGGVAEGLIRAGFDVTGIDINRKNGKVYPGKFICSDAVNPGVNLAKFDFIWASPPCQRFSAMTKKSAAHRHPDLLDPIRDLLSGHKLTCIENVPNAPIRADLKLTGPMVGLNRIIKLRHFELSFFMLQPDVPPKGKLSDWPKEGKVCITTSLGCRRHFYYRKEQGLNGRLSLEEAREVMGIMSPMNAKQIGESIPPAYAEYIGKEAMKYVGNATS